MAKILIVDDAIDLLHLFPFLLEPHGHLVVTVSSLPELANRIDQFNPDLVIMDVRFNGEDGRRLCKQIREKDENDMAIILMSASGNLLKNFTEWKADAVIEKPFDMLVLYKTINDVLSKRKMLR